MSLHKEMKGRYYTEDPLRLKGNDLRKYIFNAIFVEHDDCDDDKVCYKCDDRTEEICSMCSEIKQIEIKLNAENRN